MPRYRLPARLLLLSLILGAALLLLQINQSQVTRAQPLGNRTYQNGESYRSSADPAQTVKTSGAGDAGGWHTAGTQIRNPSGQPFAINGINWYGFETTGFVAHGLYAQNHRTIIDQIEQYGYNTIRITFSNQMWETDPVPARNTISAEIAAFPSLKGKGSRDYLATIINYAGSLGLHVILENHRSTAGNGSQENGLWYFIGRGKNFPEQSWIDDWVSIQQWLHGIKQTQGTADTVSVDYLAKDGSPVVLGFDLRDEPHTPSRTAYLSGATWGTGDGIDPQVNPNPNSFAPACVASSSCHDWRLAAERAADTILKEADNNGWDYPLIFVEGIGQYPTPTGTAANGPYSYYWWGGELEGVNGNANNAGAPIVLNAGGDASSLGPAITDQLVYSAHDYGPSLYKQGWFNSSTCYQAGCSNSSLASIWQKYWAYINLPGGIDPIWPGHTSYPWGETGHTPYTQAPMFIGEFGTGNSTTDLASTGPGSQGQWFTDLLNFIQSSFTPTSRNNSKLPVTNLQWSYWAVNGEDSYSLLKSNYLGLENPQKEYSFLCFVQQGPFAVPLGTAPGQCGSTGALPNPE